MLGWLFIGYYGIWVVMDLGVEGAFNGFDFTFRKLFLEIFWKMISITYFFKTFFLFILDFSKCKIDFQKIFSRNISENIFQNINKAFKKCF